MDEPHDKPPRLTPPQRNNFFFGKMMGVAQFEREQRYGMGQRWLVNRLTIGSGILCGLEVTPIDEGKRLRVAPGVAVDPWGREIVVPRPVDFDPFAAGGGCGCGEGTPITEADKPYLLCLTYRECTTNDQPVVYADDCPDQPDCQPDTTVETFALSLGPVETTQAFNCGTWTAPVVTDGVSTPPTIADLRQRLIDQLGNSCAPAATTCVPLALVTASKSGDAWKLSVSLAPARRIYTQAQLLEMILCLAQCCGSGHPETPPTGTLKINDLQFLRITASGAPGVPGRLLPVSPQQAGVYPPVFDAVPATGGTWDPLVLQVVFNQAVEGSTVVTSPLLPQQPLGYTLTRTPPGGTEAEVSGITSLLEDANALLTMICPGDPGVYRLVMRGDPVPATGNVPALPAVTTWDLDQTKRQLLDGDNKPPHFPSGLDNRPGGDFTFGYELRDSIVTVALFDIEAVVFRQGAVDKPKLTAISGTIISTQLEVDVVWILFNAPVDLDSVRAGLTVTRVQGSTTVPLNLDQNDPRSIRVDLDPANKNAVILAHRDESTASGDQTVYPPFPPPARYQVTLSASVIREAPNPDGTARPLSGRRKQPNDPFPTEGAPGAVDFVFDFTIKH